MSYEQVVNQGMKYINGLRVTNNATTPNTKLDVALGQCRDVNNVFDMVLDAAVTIDFAVDGANGLDTGAIAANTWYYIYLISSPITGNATAAMASASTTPLMPFGYEAYRLIGYARAGAGSTLLLMTIAGDGNYRYHAWDAHIQVLNNGAATTLTAIDLVTAVPTLPVVPVILGVEFTPAVAAEFVSFANATSVATALPFFSGSVAAVAQKGQMKVMATLSTTSKIQYINSAALGNTDVFVDGFEYFL